MQRLPPGRSKAVASLTAPACDGACNQRPPFAVTSTTRTSITQAHVRGFSAEMGNTSSRPMAVTASLRHRSEIHLWCRPASAISDRIARWPYSVAVDRLGHAVKRAGRPALVFPLLKGVDRCSGCQACERRVSVGRLRLLLSGNRVCSRLPVRYEIQSIRAGFRVTAGASDLGRPTIMGATGVSLAESFKSDLPSGVASYPCAKPIQHVPSPAACAASIRFSAASEQSSTTHGPVDAEITINAGAR